MLTGGQTSDARAVRFRTVYRDYLPRILGYVLRRVDAPEEAEDVVAETFLVAWRRLDDAPDDEEIRAWLYGVARNTLRNHRRGVRRAMNLESRLRVEALGASDERPERGTGPTAEAFARLRPEEREVLALLIWEGLDPGEVASVIGCSRNALRIRAHRARRRLAKELTRMGVSPGGGEEFADVLAKPSPLPEDS